MDWLVLVAGLGAFWGLGALASAWQRRGELRNRELTLREAGLKRGETAHTERVSADREAIEVLAREKALGFPWLATAYAEYFELQELRLADHLRQKKHPAKKAAQTVKETAARRREAERMFRITRDRIRYYEDLFPWLLDFVSEDIDGLLNSLRAGPPQESSDGGDPDLTDPAARWLSPEEFSALPSAERNQLALNRWTASRKSNWEIGRDYERYIGYLNEEQGYVVTYSGALEGLEDLGRDLIATAPGEVRVIQCKRWAADKTIHEKHIFQLYGTCIEYLIKHRDVAGTAPIGSLPRHGIEPWFVTSTKLSDVARNIAKVLGVTVVENEPLEPYPRIKCNTSRPSGERIYHLPFDQQYDRVVIEPKKGECYVETTAEAEHLGFRRAYRWRGG